MTVEEKRTFYHGQTALLRFKELLPKLRDDSIFTKEEKDELAWMDLEEVQCSGEEFTLKARDQAIAPFALIKDGKWYQKGEMGWWAVITDEKDQDNWNKECNKLLDECSEDALISLYDCHI